MIDENTERADTQVWITADLWKAFIQRHPESSLVDLASWKSSSRSLHPLILTSYVVEPAEPQLFCYCEQALW